MCRLSVSADCVCKSRARPDPLHPPAAAAAPNSLDHQDMADRVFAHPHTSTL